MISGGQHGKKLKRLFDAVLSARMFSYVFQESFLRRHVNGKVHFVELFTFSLRWTETGVINWKLQRTKGNERARVRASDRETKGVREKRGRPAKF